MQLSDLPVHASVVDALRRAVEADDGWRWLELSCSLAHGRGDEHSDIDVGVGHDLPTEELAAAGQALVERLGPSHGVLVHAEDSWPDGTLRFAVELQVGVQVDLVLMPALHRPGLPEESVALVDKDGTLATAWTPPVAGVTADQASEWVMLGWWSVSNSAKYLRRRSLFEATESVREVRTQALRLFATGRGVPYPSFGLTTLLDHPPFELPDGLGATFAIPDDPVEVLDAALAAADLLAEVTPPAGQVLGVDLQTAWADIAKQRLRAAEQVLRSPGI